MITPRIRGFFHGFLLCEPKEKEKEKTLDHWVFDGPETRKARARCDRIPLCVDWTQEAATSAAGSIFPPAPALSEWFSCIRRSALRARALLAAGHYGALSRWSRTLTSWVWVKAWQQLWVKGDLPKPQP